MCKLSAIDMNCLGSLGRPISELLKNAGTLVRFLFVLDEALVSDDGAMDCSEPPPEVAGSRPRRKPRCCDFGSLATTLVKENAMSILGWIRGNRDNKIITHCVEGIVARHTATVRDATVARAAGMQPAEARGYIRAKAVAIVATVLDKQIEKGDVLERRLREIVLTLTAERLTAVISAQLSHGSKPATKRKAA